MWKDYIIKDFKIGGQRCFIFKHPTSGHLNGYVALPEWHELYGVHYGNYEQDFDVHGGITYSGRPEGLEELWLVGFDCNHYMDIAPRFPPMGSAWATYKDEFYVTEELEKLVDQLFAEGVE